MRTLQKASAGYLWRHPWQLALALLGIATGVAVIVAVDLANSSAQRAFTLSMQAVTGKATHQLVGGPRGLDETVYRDLRVAGFNEVAPVIEGLAVSGNKSLRLLGVDPFAEREFRGFTDTSAGDDPAAWLRPLLTESGTVLLSAAAATTLDLQPGDTFTVEIGGIPRDARLVALLDSPRQGADDLLVTDIATAQHWLDMHGLLSRIDVIADQPGDAASLRQHVPEGTQLLSAAGRNRAVIELSRAFSVNLTAMSLLALLIGVFLIYNSVSFAVLQRRQLLGVLRALGLTRGQILRLILGEAAVLGISGACIGLVVGTWLGDGLLALVSRSINDLYFRVSVTELILNPASLGKGFAAGVAATLLAALLPAIEASSYAPRLAMSRIALERQSGHRVGQLAAWGLLMAAASLPLIWLTPGNLVVGLLSLFLLVIGFALCIPWCVAKLSLLADRRGGQMWRMAVRGISANLSRTGIAVVALAVALSATIGVSVMVSSFRLAVTDWLDNSLRADLYVAAPGGELDPALSADLIAVPGIAGHSKSRRVWIESPAGRVRLHALQLPAGVTPGGELIDAVSDDVAAAFRERGAVLVSESFAYRQGIGAGDSLRLMTQRGERAFPVVAVYRSYDSHPDTVLMNRDIYRLFWDDTAVDGLGLYLADGHDAATVSEALRAIAEDRQAVAIRSNSELRSLSLAIFDRTFVITDVLYWLATGVAVVGILAAMLALQLERGRELATLRALGLTRGQLAVLVSLQSSVIGFFSGLAAIPLGLVMAACLVLIINRRAFGWSMPLEVPAGQAFIAVGLAVAVSLLAGLYPAWRAGRLSPATAMREE